MKRNSQVSAGLCLLAATALLSPLASYAAELGRAHGIESIKGTYGDYSVPFRSGDSMTQKNLGPQGPIRPATVERPMGSYGEAASMYRDAAQSHRGP